MPINFLFYFYRGALINDIIALNVDYTARSMGLYISVNSELHLMAAGSSKDSAT